MTMKALVSHDTALAYWRQHFPLDSELGRTARVSKVEKCASCKDEVLDAVPETFRIEGRPVDVLVFDASARRHSSQVTCHFWGGDLPKGSFYRVSGMVVSSPEFVFLQMARKLTVVQLVALGCELCGTYICLPRDAKHPGAIDEFPTRISPLTTTAKLKAFVDSAKNAKGAKNAQRALRFVVDGSRSPMETRVYLQLCLSPMLGGYGLPKPLMNARIELGDEARMLSRKGHCEGDLCWPAAKLDIEYHGEVHVGASEMKSDVGRTLAIEHEEWKVITLTSPQVLDIGQFEVVAKQVSTKLGKRLMSRVLGMTPSRCGLHDELDAWMFGE